MSEALFKQYHSMLQVVWKEAQRLRKADQKSTSAPDLKHDPNYDAIRTT